MGLMKRLQLKIISCGLVLEMISVLIAETKKNSPRLGVIFSFVIHHQKENLTSLCTKRFRSKIFDLQHFHTPHQQ